MIIDRINKFEMFEKINKFREYLDYIEERYSNVQKAWRLINEKCQNKGFNFIYDDAIWHSIELEVKYHDASKLSAEEFTQYRQFFFPCMTEMKDKNVFEMAWQHHKSENPHHWEVWTSKDYKGDKLIAFIHNIIDWVAMGFKFDDTARDYYERNKEKIKLPEWAVKLMYEIFECIY